MTMRYTYTQETKSEYQGTYYVPDGYVTWDNESTANGYQITTESLSAEMMRVIYEWDEHLHRERRPTPYTWPVPQQGRRGRWAPRR
jgi:hypothetical protein